MNNNSTFRPPPAEIVAAAQGRADPRPTDLLPDPEAAAYLGCKASSLATWRCTGAVKIPYVKIGRLVRYRRADLDRFIAANLRGEG